MGKPLYVWTWNVYSISYSTILSQKYFYNNLWSRLISEQTCLTLFSVSIKFCCADCDKSRTKFSAVRVKVCPLDVSVTIEVGLMWSPMTSFFFIQEQKNVIYLCRLLFFCVCNGGEILRYPSVHCAWMWCVSLAINLCQCHTKPTP